MPARLPLLLVAASALATAAVAQTAPPTSAPDAAPLTVYAGPYEADGGSMEVVLRGGGLALVARGAPVAARLAPLAPPHVALDARAERLLAGWAVGDLSPLLAAVRPNRQATAAADFAAYRHALVRAHGAVAGAHVVASFRQADGRAVTLARIDFADAAEWASFVWAEDGRLLTLTRGVGPVVVGTVRPAGRDTFRSAGPAVWFSRGADGRIDGLHLGTGPLAMR